MRSKRTFTPLLGAALLPVALATGANPAFGQAVGRAETVPGQIVLYMQPGVPEAEARALANTVNPASVLTLKLKDCYVLYLPAARATDAATADAVAVLRQNPKIRSVRAMPFYKLTQTGGTIPTRVPNDPRFREQWGMLQINMPQAWVLQRGAAGVRIAVIDSGFAPNHEDTLGQIDPASFDHADNDSDVTADGTGAGFDHGSSVSSVPIAKTDNGIGIAGICWENVKAVCLKIQRAGQQNLDGPAILNSYQYVMDNHQRLNIVAVNMSYIAIGADPNDTTAPEYVATKALADAGVLMIAGAGNSASDTTMSSPAGLRHVISVSGTNQAGRLANYSSFGKVELAAPGGETAVQDDPGGILTHINDPVRRYEFVQGTSFACPQVTGVAALMRSVPGVTPTQARDTMFQAARKTGLGTLPDRNFGFGTLDAYEALLRVSVQALVTGPDGLNAQGVSSDPANIIPPPIATFKPRVSFRLSNIPTDGVKFIIDDGIAALRKEFTLTSLLNGTFPLGVSELQVTGNATGPNPMYDVSFRVVFPTDGFFQHTVKIEGTNPTNARTSSDTRIFTVSPHVVPSGLSMFSMPFYEAPADAPAPSTGTFRDATQLLPGATLFRYLLPAEIAQQPVNSVRGAYATFGTGATVQNVNASFRPINLRPTAQPAVVQNGLEVDTRPLGIGYFINTTNAIPVQTFGINYNLPFRIPLREGWNLVGNPYTFSVPFNSAQLETNSGVRIPVAQGVDQNLIIPHIYRLQGGEYSFRTLPDGALEAWEAHWIFVRPQNPLNLNPNPVLNLVLTPTPISATRSSRSSARPSVGNGGWTLNLQASVGDKRDGNNLIGMTARATDGEDNTKVPKPPMPFGDVELKIVRPNSDAGFFAQDLRSVGGVKQWDIQVSTNRPNANVLLNWSDIRNVPRNYRLTLTDKVTGQTIDLRNSSSYQFNAGENAATRSFTVTARPTNALSVRPVISNISVNPSRSNGRDATIYDINYNVSNDAQVSISILSFNGREVARIGTTRAVNSGDNRVTWNGRDNAGRPVAAGSYVLQIQATTPDDSKPQRSVLPLIISGR